MRAFVLVSLLVMGAAAFVLLPCLIVNTMQENKSQTDDIREQGYKSGMLGFPKETCPYDDRWGGSARRTTWLEGWADGKIQALWWQPKR